MSTAGLQPAGCHLHAPCGFARWESPPFEPMASHAHHLQRLTPGSGLHRTVLQRAKQSATPKVKLLKFALNSGSNETVDPAEAALWHALYPLLCDPDEHVLATLSMTNDCILFLGEYTCTLSFTWQHGRCTMKWHIWSHLRRCESRKGHL